MVQIIDLGPKRTGFHEQLLGGLEKGLDTYSQYQQEKQSKQKEEFQKQKTSAALKQLTGMDIGDLSPELQKAFLTEHLKGKESEKGFGREIEKIREKSRLDTEAKAAELAGKKERETAEKTAPFQAGLDVLSQMRKLRQKGNLGFGSSVKSYFDMDTQRDRGEYAQLGKSLISLASNIPIRNQQEFQTLAEKLYDPSVTDSEAEGILTAMERIMTNAMGGEGIGGRVGVGSSPNPQEKPKERPPLSSFHR